MTRSHADKPDLTGFLIIDKPRGMSSMQAVARIRRRARGGRTGHAGTLDPLATGVLIIAIGRTATRSIDTIVATTKQYETKIDLSAFTATDDSEGEREEIDVRTPPRDDAVQSAVERFIGRIEQRPPAFSAVKVGGQRAYAAARRGEALDLKPRQVEIQSIEILSYDWPMLSLRLTCSKGTYVRSLARDVGTTLGTGGHCAMIRRTAVGPFTIEQAMALDDVPDPLRADDLIPVEKMAGIIDQAKISSSSA